MRQFIAIITMLIFVSCNSGNDKQTDAKSDTTQKDTIIENTAVSDKHRDAQTDIIRTWRIYKDISRDGEKCDSISINDGSCKDKNTEMITLLTFSADGKYSLRSGFKNNYPGEDNGTWKVSGTKYGIDVLSLESHTKKNGVDASATNAITTYIVQNISFQHLVLIDADLFNTMYFIPDPKPVK